MRHGSASAASAARGATASVVRYHAVVLMHTGAAPTLSALHGLTLGELEVSQSLGLAAFARLRALTLRQLPAEPEVMCATLLPLSLVELRLKADGPEQVPPLLSSFGRLHQLRRITFANYFVWHFRTGVNRHQRFRRSHLPYNLEVGTADLNAVLSMLPRMSGSGCDMALTPGVPPYMTS